MREIKFRQPTLWKGKKFHSWHYWGFCEGGYTGPLCIDLPSFQYTGLKDKNGQEIYEGDVLRTDDSIGYVKWIGFRAAFRVRVPEGGWGKKLDYIRRKTEVIGNVYEHPNLLEVSNV